MAIHIEFKGRTPVNRNEKEGDPDNHIAAWLRDRLQDSGIAAGGPTRYDWGYEIPIHARGAEYFAGLSSRKDNTSNWHLFLEKRRSIRDRLRGLTMPPTEPMALLIQEIIQREPRFKVVRIEERH